MDPNQTFIIIPDVVQRNTAIDWPHRAIWGIIYAFSAHGGECWLSVDQIAERIHRKRRQTSAMIQTMVDLGLVEIVSFNGRKRSLRTTLDMANAAARNSAHVQPAAHQPSGIPHISRAEFRASAERNSAHIENKIENNQEKKRPSGKKKSDVVILTKSKSSKSESKTTSKSSGQKPTSIDECRQFFSENHSNDADAFWDYWQSTGWKRRTGAIVCWKSTARGWIRRNQQSNGTIDKSKPFNPTTAIQWANQ